MIIIRKLQQPSAMIPALGIFIFSLLAAGCGLIGDKQQIVVPIVDTPREQLRVAEEQYARARRTFDEEQKPAELKAALRAYDVVIERYPNDERYTPAAWIRKGEIYDQLEQYERAARIYREAAAKYSDMNDIHVTSLWGMAQAYEELDEPERTNAALRQLIDLYGDSTDPNIQQVVELARKKYRIVRISEK